MSTSLSNRSFFTVAAWYCWTAPLVASSISTAIYVSEGDTRYHRLGDPAGDIAFYVCISALVLGVVSLFGIRRHGARVILWKALLGILLSFLCGFYEALGIWSRIARQ